MNLIEFWKQDGLRNAYLDEAEFSHIYVRKGMTSVRFEDGTSKIEVMLHIANVEAASPRTGALGRLLERIDKELKVPVFIENLTSKDITEGLLAKYGFKLVNNYGYDFCFCLFREARE